MSLIKSFGYAFAGINTAFREQRNLRIHAVAFVVVVAAGFYFKVTTIEWCVLLLTCAIVTGLEMLNTAIEYLTDIVSPQKHVLAGKAKDVAAGAVLITAIIAVVVGALIFVPYIFR